MQTLIDRYAIADSLALSYQRRTKRALFVLIFVLGLVGVFTFELFAHGPEEIQAGSLAIYLGLIGIAFIVYRVANLREIKTRHLDYRALAEGLRLQIFWKLAGVREPVTDYYLAKQRTELDWVRDAIRRWSAEVVEPKERDWVLIGNHWIRNQFEFFTKAAKRNHKAHFFEVLCYRALLILVVVLGLGTILAQMADAGGRPETFHEPWHMGLNRHGVLVIIMTMLPAFAGAISAYSLKMAFSEQRRQYERMRKWYERGLLSFEKAMQRNAEDRDELVQKVVRELGREALSENADWVLMHRERGVEMFVGG
jgi:hypothetical protein